MRGLRGGSIVDPLYGLVTFDEEINALIATPIVQRLRHIVFCFEGKSTSFRSSRNSRLMPIYKQLS